MKTAIFRGVFPTFVGASLLAFSASPAFARSVSQAPKSVPSAAAPAPAAGTPAPAASAPSGPEPVAAPANPPTVSPIGEPIWISEASPWEARRLGAGGQRPPAADHDHAAMRSESAAAASPNAGTAMSEARNAEAAAEAMVDMSTHSGAKTLWLRRGDDPATASVVKADGQVFTLRIVGTDGKSWESQFADNSKGVLQAKVDLPDMGFYSAYLQSSAAVAGVRDVTVAKAELLKANCCSKRDVDLYRPAIDDALPIELVREHKPDEKVMTRILSGERAVYFVRSFGAPVEGAKVTIQTQEGWRKRAFTDAQGRVEFTLVRDYFPDWSDFNRRKTGTFLVLAEFERPEAGNLGGVAYGATRYHASMAGRYYPAPYDYQSYAWGLGIVVGVLLVGGFGVWLYRQRRTRAYREIVFDERVA